MSSLSNTVFAQYVARPIEFVGGMTTRMIGDVGRFMLFSAQTVRQAVHPPFRAIEIIQQMEFIGNQSFGIIVMSAFAIGAVFALQVGMVFRTFSAEGQMGIATSTALARELAPMMTAFLLTGRAGSAITAEIATMKVNEQVDAMESMGVSPLSYLVVPRLIASMIMTPLLSGMFVFVGVLGAYLVGTVIFSVDEGMFFHRIVNELEPKDVWIGLEKAFLFSIVIALIACQYGLRASGGAKGVGRATTNSVIASLLVVLLLDFVYTFFQVAI